jgi:predicted nucleic acid-binding protein
MPVLVDTSVWSLALRRNLKHLDTAQTVMIANLKELIRGGQARLIGPIRQELLTGIREQRQFERLRDDLRVFPDTTVVAEDYEAAAAAANRCIAAGIAVQNVDLLICAVAMNRDWEIYTTDDDFLQYSRRFPIRLRQRQSG